MTRVDRGGPAWALVLASYTGVFAILCAPLLASFASALPAQPNPQDAQVITWALAWVAHALSSDPSRLFDANVAHPAPAQLAGTDHLLGAQLLFLPLAAATGNPVLAANLTAFLGYPLAALAMERLLARSGASAAVRWGVGLAYAIGVLRAPFNLHVLIYPAFVLPWVAYALVALRERPQIGAALWTVAALAAGAFSSAYGAVLAAWTAVVWGACELVRPLAGRTRYAALALGAGVATSAALLGSLGPYLELVGRVRRTAAPALALADAAPDAGDPASIAAGMADGVGRLVSRGLLAMDLLPASALAVWIADGALAIAAVALALHALRSGAPLARRAVAPAIALALPALVLARGYPAWLEPWIAATPLPFFRFTHRFLVLAGFGGALLLAAGIDALPSSRGRPARALALGALALVLLPRALALGAVEMWPVGALGADAALYDRVAERLAREGGGALLELPLRGPIDRSGRGGEAREDTLEPDAILATAGRWWPTPASHLSYQPEHRWLFLRLVAQLPDAAALDDLIDMTRVRWLLLRPASYWRGADARAAFLARLRFASAVGDVEELDGWTLVRLDRAPAHPHWYAAIARGDGGDDRTVLGTPLAPLDPARTRAVIEIARAEVPGASASGATGVPGSRRLALALRVTNAGTAAWPATPRSGRTLGVMGLARLAPLPVEGAVALVAAWRTDDGARADAARAPAVLPRIEPVLLARDVDGGETIAQRLVVPLPGEPGAYELEIAVAQMGGATFTGPGDGRARVRVEVDAGGVRVAGVSGDDR